MKRSVPSVASKICAAIVEKGLSGSYWLRCDRNAARFSSRNADTSTTVVISASGMPTICPTSIGRIAPELACPALDLLDGTARHRVHVRLRRLPLLSAQQIERGKRRQVRLDMVRVPVRAVRGVGHDCIGSLLAEVRGNTLRHLVQWRRSEGARIPVARGPCHPRVAVAEELLPVDTEDRARSHQLGGAHLAKSRPDSRRIHVVNVPLLASRRGEQDDADALVVRAQHDAARRDALIVGMRVNEQQCCHADIA